MKENPAEPEFIFGNIKKNKKFKRFYPKGFQKVKSEFGLIAVARNLVKWAVVG